MSKIVHYARHRLELKSQEVNIKVDDKLHATVNEVPIGTIDDITGSNVTLAPVGAAPNNNAATLSGLSGQVLTLEPADATHPGLIIPGVQTFGAGTKTFIGDVFANNLPGPTANLSLTPVGAAPNANGALISGNNFTLEPCSVGFPGVVTVGNQTLGNGIKTITEVNSGFLILDRTINPSAGIIHDNNEIVYSSTGSPLQFTRFLAGAGNSGSSGADCTGVGVGALASHSTGDFDTCVGFHAGTSITGGDKNSLYGHQAGTGLTTAQDCTAIGYNSLQLLSTGANCIAIGSSAGASLTASDSNNIDIGHLGVSGDNRVIRIGNSGTHTGNCYIQAIFGKTTDVVTGVPVNVDSAGLLGTVVSSEKYKEGIEPLQEGESEKLYQIPVRRFRMIGQEQINYGPIAEEVNKVFPELVVYEEDVEKYGEQNPKQLRSHFFAPLMLDQLQKLNKRVIELESRRDAPKRQKK